MRGFSTIQSIIGRAAMLGESAVRDDADAWIEFHLDEVEMSHGDLANLLRMALKAEYPGQNTYVWLRDVYDDSVVYEVTTDGTDVLYQRSYALLDDQVTFGGDPVKVVAVTQYVPVTEAERQELTGDLVPLTERAVAKDGAIRIKVIQAGQGSSGYYPAEVLKRDGPKVFTSGLHMHLDHPSVSEESDRPERSVATLAGTLTSDATWEENGAAGPGLYADAKVRSDLAPLIEELAPHIGVSIRALGRAGTREIEGRKVRSIEALELAKSIDFVTVAGAGGKVLDLVEAARGRRAGGGAPPQKESDVADKEIVEKLQKDLTEADRKNADLERRILAMEQRDQEGRLLRESRAVVVETLAAITLPKPTRERLTETLAADPPTKDGALDREALVAKVKEAATTELAYLAEITGGGQVRDMGSTPDPLKPEEASKRLSEAFSRLTGSKKLGELAATGR